MAKDSKGHGSNARSGPKPLSRGTASKQAVAVLGALREGKSHPALIAKHAGMDLKTANKHLQEMHSNGLVDRKIKRGSDHSRYTLTKK